MDILADKSKSVPSRSNPFSAIKRRVQGLFGWLIDFFSLSDEDREKAGIYRGGEGRG